MDSNAAHIERDPFPVGTSTGSLGSAFSTAPEKRQINLSNGEQEASDNGADEEAENYTMTRMLEDGDGTGTLLYVGDSSTLSFLQLLRVIVENATGPTAFSSDPGRHQITETQFNVSRHINLTHTLPDKTTALVLVESFFVNTHGMIEVFDEQAFLAIVEEYYSEPLATEYTWLCLFNLVLAIGLCLATPKAGSREANIVNNIRSKHPNLSEIFFLTARHQTTSLVELEDACLWSIQVHTLMSFYMMTRSRRNAAYVYAGIAVRSAYALGIHREETLVIFDPSEQAARRKIWRSLFVLDRFLAVSLGRPVAIAEEESSRKILNSLDSSPEDGPIQEQLDTCAAGLTACVQSCHVIGKTLRRVYSQRKISVKQAQTLCDECKRWTATLSPRLHWKQASPQNVRQAIAILHCNMAHWHSVILLTRPFFLYLLNIDVQRNRLNNDLAGPRRRPKIEKFAEACMIASIHTVALCYHAYQGGYLPRLNPFPTYSTFSAALIISANEFARPSTNPLAAQCMHNAITVLRYCGEIDPQAQRAVSILESFRDVIRTPPQPNLLGLDPVLQVPPSTSAPFMPPTFTENQGLPPLPASVNDPCEIPTSQPLPSIPESFLSLSNSSDGQTNLLLPGHLPDEYYFSGLLDLENNFLPTSDEGSHSSVDEDFEFDSLWEWPGGIAAKFPEPIKAGQGLSV